MRWGYKGGSLPVNKILEAGSEDLDLEANIYTNSPN